MRGTLSVMHRRGRSIPASRSRGAGGSRAGYSGGARRLAGFRRLLYGVIVVGRGAGHGRSSGQGGAGLLLRQRVRQPRIRGEDLGRAREAVAPGEDVTVAGRRGIGSGVRGVTCHVRPNAQVVVVQVASGCRPCPISSSSWPSVLPLVDLVVAGDWMVRRTGLRPSGTGRRGSTEAAGRAGALARDRGGGTSERRSTLRWRRGCGCSWCWPASPSPRSTSRSETVEGEVLRRYDLAGPGCG